MRRIKLPQQDFAQISGGAYVRGDIFVGHYGITKEARS